MTKSLLLSITEYPFIIYRISFQFAISMAQFGCASDNALGVLTPFRVYVDDLGVHTRNWPRIDFQPSELNFEFYVWRFREAAFC